MPQHKDSEGRGAPERPHIVTESDVSDAVLLLTGKSCNALGTARAVVERATHMLKRARAASVLQSNLRTADLREAEAVMSEDSLRWINTLYEATVEAETLYAQRRGAEAVVQVFQTMEASRRAARV